MSEPHLSLLQFRASPTTKAVNRGERKKEFFLERYSTQKKSNTPDRTLPTEPPEREDGT